MKICVHACMCTLRGVAWSSSVDFTLAVACSNLSPVLLTAEDTASPEWGVEDGVEHELREEVDMGLSSVSMAGKGEGRRRRGEGRRRRGEGRRRRGEGRRRRGEGRRRRGEGRRRRGEGRRWRGEGEEKGEKERRGRVYMDLIVVAAGQI